MKRHEKGEEMRIVDLLKKDAIILNAAGALVVGGKAADFTEGIALAREIIESGKAAEKLAQLVEESNKYSEQ